MYPYHCRSRTSWNHVYFAELIDSAINKLYFKMPLNLMFVDMSHLFSSCFFYKIQWILIYSNCFLIIFFKSFRRKSLLEEIYIINLSFIDLTDHKIAYIFIL